jgi:hypothetical protein
MYYAFFMFGCINMITVFIQVDEKIYFNDIHFDIH